MTCKVELRSREESVLREEALRQRALEAQRQQELAQLKAVEAAKRKGLETELEAWEKAKHIRQYVVARVAYETESGTLSEETKAWRDWALAYADMTDPILLKVQAK